MSTDSQETLTVAEGHVGMCIPLVVSAGNTYVEDKDVCVYPWYRDTDHEGEKHMTDLLLRPKNMKGSVNNINLCQG